jgi:hypothetical protein
VRSLGSSASQPPVCVLPQIPTTPLATEGKNCHVQFRLHHLHSTREAASSASTFLRRVALSIVLTAFNVAVIANYGGTLYRETTGNPLQQAGVTLLFAALLGSLARVWFLALRSRPR